MDPREVLGWILLTITVMAIVVGLLLMFGRALILLLEFTFAIAKEVRLKITTKD